MLHGAWSDDRRSDGRVFEHKGEGEFNQRYAGFFGESRQLVDRLELPLVPR